MDMAEGAATHASSLLWRSVVLVRCLVAHGAFLMHTIAMSVPAWVQGFYWLAIVPAALATILTWLIVRDTNKHNASKDSYLGWRLGKMERIFTRYEQLFPAGRKVFWFKVSFIAAGWALGLWVFLEFWYSR